MANEAPLVARGKTRSKTGKTRGTLGTWGAAVLRPYEKKEAQQKAPPTGSGPLQGGEGGEFGVGDGLLLEEDLEAFAHAFGEDEGFELQARADTVGFIHAVVEEVGELVPLS